MKRSFRLTSSQTVQFSIVLCLFIFSIYQPSSVIALENQSNVSSSVAQTTCAPLTLNSPEPDFIATDQTITFSWTAPTDCIATSYTIMIDFDDNMTYPFVTYQSLVNTTWTYKIDGSWNNRDLFWGVKAAVGLVDGVPQPTTWSIRPFHTDFTSVKITHDLPVFNGVKRDSDLPQPLYFLPMNSSTTLSATVSGSQVTNPAINWEIRSGGGALTNSNGATTTFQSGSAMSDTVIRATSVEFPDVYDEFSIHTFADFNVNMQYLPEVLYDSVNDFYFDPIMDGYFALDFESDYPTLNLLGVVMNGAGSMESTTRGFKFHSPSSEQSTNFHLYIKEYPTYSKDVQVNTVYGGPINVPSVCFTPEQWYGSAGSLPENKPFINSIYYQYAPIGEMMTVRLGVGVKAPATEPVYSVKITINNPYDYFGPYPLDLESGTAVNGVWSATFPSPDTLCKNKVLIMNASNALFTAQQVLYPPLESDNLVPARPEPSGVYDSSFNPGSGTDSNISKATLQQDGKILIVGDFTHYNEASVGRITRLNSDGSLDLTFNTGSGADWTVNTAILQPDGKILIGGAFTSFDGNPRSGIARLNTDGSLDLSFDPGDGFDYVVNTLQLQPDGKIFVGGNFSSYNNNPAYDLIRLNPDGSIDTGFDTGIGADKAIKDALLLPDGKLLIVGDFDRYNRIAFPHVARINPDGSLDQSYLVPFGTEASNLSFRNITASPQGNIYLSGYSVFLGRAFRLNSYGEADPPLEVYDDGLVSGLVYGTIYSTIELADGRVLLAGSFYQLVPPGTSGISYPLPHLMMLNIDGTWDTSFTAFTNQFGTIDQLLPISDTQVLTVGRFSVIDGVDSNGIALLSLKKPPVFLTTTLPIAEFGQPYSAQLKASGLPLPTFTVTSGVLPNGININNNTGVMSGTPTEAGDFDFTIEASNGINPADTQDFSLTVNEAPVITSNGGGPIAGISVAENSTIVTTVTATDSDTNAILTYSISGGVDAAIFTINSISGELAFVSPPSFENPMDVGLNNIYDVIVQVSDGSLTDSQSVAATVTNVNNSPVITEGSTTNVNMSENSSPTPFNLTLHATDVDGGDTITWSISTVALHGTATASGIGASKPIVYIPDLNYYGSDSFVVQVTDGFGGIDNITVNVTITSVELPSITIFLPLILR